MAITHRYVTDSGTDTYANSTNIATPMSLATAIANAAAGDYIHFKKGTYTLAANFTPVNAGTVASPIFFEGYNSTIGDLETGTRSATSLAIDATNYPVIAAGASWKVLVNTNYVILKNLSVTCSQNASAVEFTTASSGMVQCKILTSGSASSTVGLKLGAGSYALDCDIEASNSGSVNALYMSNQHGRAIGCRIKGTSTTYGAVWMDSDHNVLARCIVWSAAGYGVIMRGTANGNVILDCTFYCPNATNGDCVKLDNVAGVELPMIINCSMTDSNRAFNNANSGTSSRPIIRYYNRTRDNTNADVGAGDWPEFGRVTTDTGGPTSDFGDLTGGTDYSPASGSPLLGAGHVPYLDIGAIQRQATAAGGVAIIS